MKVYRWKLLLWIGNTVIATFFGIWLGDEISCLGKARDKVEAAASGTGFMPYREECFILPPVVDVESNKDEVLITEKAILSAEKDLSQCRLAYFFGKEFQRLKREIMLAKANFSLLKSDCRVALKEMNLLRREGELSREASITWAWAKVESDPSESSYRKAIETLRGYQDEDACLATTRGSLLRRLALRQEAQRDELLRAALKEHDRAIALNPRSVLADYNRAVVLLDLGEIDEAQIALDSAKDRLGGRRDPYWHNTQGKIYDLNGKNDAALNELTAAVESGYPDPEFRLSRGWILLRLERYPEAARDFRRAREIAARGETSCSRTSLNNFDAEILRGLSWVKYKTQGVQSVDIDGLRRALSKVDDPQLREEMSSEVAEFVKRREKPDRVPNQAR